MSDEEVKKEIEECLKRIVVLMIIRDCFSDIVENLKDDKKGV